MSQQEVSLTEGDHISFFPRKMKTSKTHVRNARHRPGVLRTVAIPARYTTKISNEKRRRYVGRRALAGASARVLSRLSAARKTSVFPQTPPCCATSPRNVNRRFCSWRKCDRHFCLRGPEKKVHAANRRRSRETIRGYVFRVPFRQIK